MCFQLSFFYRKLLLTKAFLSRVLSGDVEVTSFEFHRRYHKMVEYLSRRCYFSQNAIYWIWLIKGFVLTRTTRRLQHVKQDILTLSEYMRSPKFFSVMKKLNREIGIQERKAVPVSLETYNICTTALLFVDWLFRYKRFNLFALPHLLLWGEKGQIY